MNEKIGTLKKMSVDELINVIKSRDVAINELKETIYKIRSIAMTTHTSVGRIELTKHNGT